MTPDEKWDRRLRLHFEKGEEALRDASRLHRELKAIEGNDQLYEASENYDRRQKEFARAAALAELHFLALRALRNHRFEAPDG